MLMGLAIRSVYGALHPPAMTKMEQFSISSHLKLVTVGE